MTSQEPHTQHIADHDDLDTEVIMVAQPAPVFVDSTGRRRRLLRRFAYGFTASCMVYGGLISLSLAGGPVSPSAVLPLPGLVVDDEPPTGDLLPRPEPVVTAPKSVLVNEATNPRSGTDGSWDGGSVATRRAAAPPARAAAPIPPPDTEPTSATRPIEGTPTSTRTPPAAPITAIPNPHPSPTVSRGASSGDTGGGPVDVDPDDTDPDDTDPDATDPDATDPGDVEPGDTEPGDTEPDEVDPGTGGGSQDECPDLVTVPSQDRADRSAGVGPSAGADGLDASAGTDGVHSSAGTDASAGMDAPAGTNASTGVDASAGVDAPAGVDASAGMDAVEGGVDSVPGATDEAMSLLVGSASPLATTDSAFGAAMQIAAQVAADPGLAGDDENWTGPIADGTATESTVTDSTEEDPR